jgi:hypothetical protein
MCLVPEYCDAGVPPRVEATIVWCGAPRSTDTMKLDGACPWSEFAGVVQYVNQNLLDLAGFEIKGQIAGAEIGCNRDGLVVGEWRNFVERLFQALPDVAALQIHATLHVAPNAQLEHRARHA